MGEGQTELGLFDVEESDPMVERLVEFLQERPGWFLAKEILGAWFLEDNESHRRMVRALAEAAMPEVLGGQKGYKWIGHASPEEVHHSAAALESQAKKMSERAGALRRRAHQLIS